MGGHAGEDGLDGEEEARGFRRVEMLQPPAEMAAGTERAPDEGADLAPVTRADEAAGAEEMVGNRIRGARIGLDGGEEVDGGGELSGGGHGVLVA